MNREICLILVDRLRRSSWTLWLMLFTVWFMLCLFLPRNTLSLGLIAAMAGFALSFTTFDSTPAVGRVCVQLPVGSINLARSGLCYVVLRAAFLFFPPVPILICIRWLYGMNAALPLSYSIALFSATVATACFFLLIQIGMGKAESVLALEGLPWAIRIPARVIILLLTAFAPFAAVFIALRRIVAPNLFDSILLLLLAGGGSALVWQLVPRLAPLYQMPDGRIFKSQASPPTNRDLPVLASPRRTIEMHFWGASLLWLILLILLRALVRFFIEPHWSSTNPTIFYWGIVFVAVAADSLLMRAMRIYRTLPISIATIVRRLCAISFLCSASFAVLGLFERADHPQWIIVSIVFFAVFAANNFALACSVRLGISDGLGVGFLAMVIFALVGSIIGITNPQLRKELLVALDFIALVLAVASPLLLHHFLASENPYRNSTNE